MQQTTGNEKDFPEIEELVLDCEAALASDSPDYLAPWGTKRDNCSNPRFNHKFHLLFGNLGRPPRVLDLGCSGGGFVKSCVDDGCFALGLEGSDYSKKHKRAEWLTIPEHLFTCDISRKFRLYGPGERREPLKFDLVTAWEVAEHIGGDRLDVFIDNIKAHLAPGGLFVGSISPLEDVRDGLKLHQSVHPKPWWVERFAAGGLTHLEEYVDYFNTQFVRGDKFDAPGSFHVALSAEPGKAPPIPRENLRSRVLDRWYGSAAQKQLKKLVTGE